MKLTNKRFFGLAKISVLMATVLTVAAGCATTAFAETKVACIGDSLTRGYLLEKESDSYPAQLQKILGNEYEVKNYGQTATYVIDDGPNEYVDSEMYPKSVAYDADVLVFMFGANDIRAYDWTPKYFENQYAEVVASYLKSGKKPKIYFIIPPEARDEYFGLQRNAVEATLSLASKFDATVIDSYNLAIGHPEYYMEDKVHLYGSFYGKLADLVAKTIKRESAVEMIDGAQYVTAPNEDVSEEILQENNRLFAAAEKAKAERDEMYKPYIEKLLAEHPDYETTGLYD
ncbi:GDSL-type esterase/lipase family protein [Oribacterium sp. WCC10]|uniref:GDSL-type esterase/lipase family protein n=1 Tax=Oribacterium sp. WCC10 TaxID=1855343 RepID=UPI0008EA88F1|nr:GDSL-type esterase/lipase family protein [Oribacterium sp. WCC10]SFG15398.1 Lysophospholipase L1 [Oribacterium sp. WCC10]